MSRRTLTATKDDARIAVARACTDGLIPRRPPACEVCGATGHIVGCRWSIVLHHHSYEVENHLDVTALCRRCHGLVHRGRIPEPVPHLYAAHREAA